MKVRLIYGCSIFIAYSYVSQFYKILNPHLGSLVSRLGHLTTIMVKYDLARSHFFPKCTPT